jgi:hypothetical protein
MSGVKTRTRQLPFVSTVSTVSCSDGISKTPPTTVGGADKRKQFKKGIDNE